MAFFKVAALDLDGTLTSKDGHLWPEALDAIDQGRRAGLVVALVTGRIAEELKAEFPEIADHVDALVLENGAVAVIGGNARLLSAPVDVALDAALADRDVTYRRGEVLVAIEGGDAATVLDVIGRLGLDCQLVRNRNSLMVLPAGVTKGSGLGAVLTEMNLSPRNTIAVGDAENDLSMFKIAEIGAAVADAVPSVQGHADLVLVHEDGAGVASLLAGPYLSGARRWCPPRRWVDIGTYDDGSPTQVPGSQARVLVTGPAGSGKSYLVGLLAERWIEVGYCVLVIDPEGDHVELQDLGRVQVVDAGRHLPEPTELVSALLRPDVSIVVDMSRIAVANKIDYMHLLRATAEAHREQHGFPHWVIYDEAHLLGSDPDAHWMRRGGYLLSSFTPAVLPPEEIDSTDVLLRLPDGDHPLEAASRPGPRATIRFGFGEVRSFTVAGRHTTHVRHRHKYADVSLPRERRFYFRTTAGQSPASAGTMQEFSSVITHLDPQSLQHHLERGDFSRWLASTIADKDLAAQVTAWEDELLAHRAADVERIRHQLVQAVRERYLDAAEPD